MARLKKRAEFVDVAKGARLNRGAFSLQARRRRTGGECARFGFTVTKKTGNAVERNRIRRRLKAALADISGPGSAGTEREAGVDAAVDYVLIGRREALTISYQTLRDDMRRALRAIDPDRPGNARRAQKHTRG